MTREERIVALSQAIGADIKALKAADGDLTSLSTTAKSNLVAAINELHTTVSNFTSIDDTSGDGTTDKTWSADKIYDTIEAAVAALKTELVGGANAALDTFKELQDALNNDATFAQTMATSLSKKVSFDTVQTLTTTEKAQACANIGVGDPDHNFLTDYTTARDTP